MAVAAVVAVVVVTAVRARCSRRPAQSVAKAPKSRFSLAVISQFTAAIAIGKFDQVDK